MAHGHPLHTKNEADARAMSERNNLCHRCGMRPEICKHATYRALVSAEQYAATVTDATTYDDLLTLIAQARVEQTKALNAFEASRNPISRANFLNTGLLNARRALGTKPLKG